MALSRETLIVALTVIATLALVWLALNLSLGNKQIDTRLTRLYTVADAHGPTNCWISRPRC